MEKGSYHIGNNIKAELKRQDRSIAWLARRVYCDRGNLSRTLKKPVIDMELLHRISICMNHNFVADAAATIELEINEKNKTV